MSFVEVRDIWQAYDGRSIIERVNLDVAERGFVSIVGASGCGKSIFLRLLLADERPVRGTITVDGGAVAVEPGREQRPHHTDLTKLAGWKAKRKEAELPEGRWAEERAWALRMGLTGADSIDDKSIPTFARGELPYYARINTFLKAPYTEDVLEVANYDATVQGIPFDGGTTYRPGTRLGPQGVRKISALYTPYNYELGVDLREQMTLCDAGHVFTIPANIEKSFDRIRRAVSHVFSSGSLPIMIGRDHSIGFPCVSGIAECTSKKIGIVHFDRHADIQEKDLDERMHTTPWFHSTNLPNVPAKTLVQIGIGGWQVPREAVKVARERETNIITMGDMEKMGIDKPVAIPHGQFEGKRWSNPGRTRWVGDGWRGREGRCPSALRPHPGGFGPRRSRARAPCRMTIIITTAMTMGMFNGMGTVMRMGTTRVTTTTAMTRTTCSRTCMSMTRRRIFRFWRRSSSTVRAGEGQDKLPKAGGCTLRAARARRWQGAEAGGRGTDDPLAGRHGVTVLWIARVEPPALSRRNGARAHQHEHDLRLNGREIRAGGDLAAPAFGHAQELPHLHGGVSWHMIGAAVEVGLAAVLALLNDRSVRQGG
ncbi:arginase family protein [Sagittula sp. S175]|uniref:arginase family protein n=1 Tax=Sagittula sp. S175 TaxID=3415129 RepID=UPI003C7A4745